VDLGASLTAKARVLRAVEAAKCHLSFHPFAHITEEFIAEKAGRSLHLDREVSREEYEELIRPLLDRTMDSVQRALDDARLAPSAIDKVILVGGSTRTPLVSRLLEERLGQPAHQEVNPDLCVALGAAIQAAIIAGMDVGAVLVDITPHTLGIRCLDEMPPFGSPFRFAPIIHRNTPLPASRSELFSTVMDSQPEVEIDVYQGESDDIRHNHRIGRFRIQGLAPVPAGNQLVVQLDLNLDGILKVSAREHATGLQKQITIENALAEYAREERAAARERLEDLWEQAAEESESVGAWESESAADSDSLASPTPALQLVPDPDAGHHGALVQAKALLEKAERLLAKMQPDDRGEVERLIERVRTALSARQWDKVTTATNELADVLFYLDDT
jgi:molecular chaperone DnaK